MLLAPPLLAPPFLADLGPERESMASLLDRGRPAGSRVGWHTIVKEVSTVLPLHKTVMGGQPFEAGAVAGH